MIRLLQRYFIQSKNRYIAREEKKLLLLMHLHIIANVLYGSKIAEIPDYICDSLAIGISNFRFRLVLKDRSRSGF